MGENNFHWKIEFEICKELGAKPTSFHKERTGMVLKGIETVGFWTSPGGKGP